MMNTEKATQETKPKMLLLLAAQQRKNQLKPHQEIKLNDLQLDSVGEFNFIHNPKLNAIKGQEKLDGVNMDNMWVNTRFSKTRPTRKQREQFVAECKKSIIDNFEESFKEFSKEYSYEKNIFLRNARLDLSTNGKMWVMTFSVDILLVEIEKKGMLTKLLNKVGL